MNRLQLNIILALLVMLVACEEGPEIDKEKPTISNSFNGAFPINCDTIYFGETFNLKMLFTDNVELGTYSIDIHNNFDHHAHSTDVSECDSDPDKTPINPFTYINDYDIPTGSKSYETNLGFIVPTGNTSGLFDEGDYHLFISLTDHEGWSTQKGVSVKILHR